MVAIFHKESVKPDQIFFSNSKNLVRQQRYLFDTLWDSAIPIDVKKKDRTYENKTDHTLQITDSIEVNTEINSLIERCTKELIIFSSIKLIHIILNNNNYLNKLSRLLKREVTIRILIDGVDQHLMRYITQLNAEIGL